MEVSFDPKVISRADLEKRGLAGCATETFASGSAIRLVEDQKYYLRQTPLRFIPMSAAQAARVHASAQAGDAERWLSPRQMAAAEIVRAAPDAQWEDLVGVPPADAWTRFRARAAELAAAQSAGAGQ